MRTDRGRPIVPAVVALDGLLHGHGTGQGPAHAGEGHHEPVAEVLDLGAPGALDGASQQSEMGLAQVVGRFGTETRRQLGGPHQVREQHRHCLGRCHFRLTPATWYWQVGKA